MKTTINKDKITHLTRKGIKELKKSIFQLENDRKKELQSLKEIEKTLGHDARLARTEKLANIENIDSELYEKKQVLSAARPLSSKRHQLRVAIGSVVDLVDRQGHRFRYKIVESVEADPSGGRISNISPIGSSLIGKTVKDMVEWSNGKHITKLRIAHVS